MRHYVACLAPGKEREWLLIFCQSWCGKQCSASRKLLDWYMLVARLNTNVEVANSTFQQLDLELL